MLENGTSTDGALYDENWTAEYHNFLVETKFNNNNKESTTWINNQPYRRPQEPRQIRTEKNNAGV